MAPKSSRRMTLAKYREMLGETMCQIAQRHPKNFINSYVVFNTKSEFQEWEPIIVRRFSRVTLLPSRTGPHGKKKKALDDRRSHWKARILSFKSFDNQLYVEVQHVYNKNEVAVPNQTTMPANYVYPSNICEWQRIESITGILDVWHAEMGEEVYRLNQENKKEVYFYNKFYECPVAGQTYGHLLDIPLPSFQSQEWEVPCTQTVESVRTKIAADIKNNMKVAFGSKRVHMKWLVPFNVFVDLFQRCQEIKKTRTMFTVAKCPETFLHELFGTTCLKKEVCTREEVVQAIFDTSCTIFKYIIKTLELHVTFSFRRYKREGTVWREMEHAGEEASMISMTVFLNNAALEDIQVEHSWTLLDVRHLLQGNECYPEHFMFFHLNKVVRKRRVSTFSVQELLENQDTSPPTR